MISVIVPVYNEEGGIVKTLGDIDRALRGFVENEIIVVNDGSNDKTLEILRKYDSKFITIIDHVENQGYGKSLYDGITAAKYECIAIIDGDGSYPADKISELYSYYPEYDMVVGARKGKEYKKGIFKRVARVIFNRLAEYASGKKIPDVNSGLRIFKKEIILRYKDSLCTGFSFTTTITLIFFLNHYYVKYVPIDYIKREGKSKVRHFKDTLRAGQIIVETILYYNPIKLFLLLANINVFSGVLLGVANYFFLEIGLLSILSAVLMSSFIPIFSLGLIADQIRKLYRSAYD